MNNPLVSVVLSTYNDERYIRQSIDAVLNQTYDNFEFIIWNDGSTDSTDTIVKSYSDKRIRYFYHENTGLGMALALACKEARGKYIARIDGDDVCLPFRFEKEVNFLESHQEVVLVSSSVIYIDKNDKVLGRSYPWTWDRNIRHQLNIVHPAAMFRRDVYLKTCGYLDIKSSQDRVLWSKMSEFGKFYIFKDPLILYRWIPSSLSHVIDMSSIYSQILEIIRLKMCTDEFVTIDDIELHNKVYQLSKVKDNTNEGGYIPPKEERLAFFFNRLFGEELSTKIIVLLKNIYAYIRY